MRPSRRFAAAGAAVVAATAVSVAAAAPVTGPAEVDFTAFRVDPGPPPVDDPFERAGREALELINRARRDAGLPEVTWQPQVASSAQGHSEYQASVVRADGGFGLLTHTGAGGTTPGRRLDLAGYAWGNWGEAVAAGQLDPAVLVDDWLDSDPHRPILLGDYAHAGVGVAVTPDQTPYWTLVVASPG